MRPRTVCYVAGTAGDWGGSSRVLFTNLRLLDRSRVSPIVWLSGNGPAEALLDEIGVPHFIWGPFEEPGRPLAYARALLRARRWLSEHRVELLHLNRANDWRPAELLAAKLCGIPCVYHLHTVNRDCSPALRSAKLLLCVSRFVARESCLQGVTGQVIHNVVDACRFSPADKVGPAERGEGPVIVTFVGQIRRIKGVEDFVRMAERIRGDHVRFRIAGECRDGRGLGDAYSEDALRELIAADPRIEYVGYQARIEALYRASDVIVAPSQWEEPFGLVLIEAGAAGLPVVATQVGGIPEVIVDGETGFLVAAGDVPALAERVQQLVDAPELRAGMGKAARSRVENCFTRQPVRLLEDCYERILAGR